MDDLSRIFFNACRNFTEKFCIMLDAEVSLRKTPICRGAAHVGVLKALLEDGIPIDMIGGTSIGALISGLYAQSDEDLQHRARSWFMVSGATSLL